MKAKTNVSKVLYHLAPVADPLLLTGVLVLPDSTTLPLVLTQMTAIPDVFRVVVPSVPAVASGQYELRILYNSVARWSDYLDVGYDAVTDFPLGEEVQLRLDAAGPGVSETITARLVSPAGVAAAAVPATFVAATYAYEFDHTFTVTDSGDWAVVWYWDAGAGVVPQVVTNLLLNKPVDQELIRFVVGDASGAGVVAHANTTVVITDEDGLIQIAQGVTDSGGLLTLALFPAIYRASLIRAGRVFSTNNFTFTVAEGDTDAASVQLASEALLVTATAPTAVAPVCTLYADIYLMDGNPLRNATVQVTLQHRPASFSGTVVFDTVMSFRTDSNGHVEFDLVQGIQVEVLITPLSLRRIITVPSAVGPSNLIALMSGADDLFDIIVPVVPAAAKRSM